MRTSISIKVSRGRILRSGWLSFLLGTVPVGVLGQPAVTLSEALLRALDGNPGIKIEEEAAKGQEARVQSAAGKFDWTAFTRATGDTSRAPRDSSVRQEVGSISAGLAKELRSGIQVLPAVSIGQFDELDTGVSQTRTDFDLVIIIPLLRGLGVSNNAVEELVAQSNLKGATYLRQFRVSARIFRTVTSYWNCMAAGENLEILVDAESRSEKTFRLIKRLVDGGEREPALIHQANAELLRKKAEVRRAELVLFQARQALAVDMGYNPVELPNAPLAEGSFPRPRDDETMPAEQSRKLIEEALVRRGDYLAAQSNVDTELILLHRSENALKPRVDFNIRVGYAEFNADSTFSDEDGLNAVAGVSVDWPIANNRARGNLEERRTWRRRAELTQAELASVVASEVLVAEASLINAREEHKIAVEAVDAYRKAVVDINRKITLGEASLIDLTEMEERYAQARTAKVNSVRKYAVAIAELQFVTGRLLSREGDDGGWKIDMRLLSQLNSSE